jgi:hypothetical protein
MARRTKGSKQRGYLGNALIAAGVFALALDLSFLVQPIEAIAARLREGLMGVLPTLGMCLLNATHAIAFHQVDYVSLISRILVLFCAMTSVIAGLSLLRPRARRLHIIELALSPELEGREMMNGSSR